MSSFKKIQSSPKSGHHKNWEIIPNPDKTRNTPKYIVKAEQKDKKSRFSKELKYNANIPFIRNKKKD